MIHILVNYPVLLISAVLPQNHIRPKKKIVCFRSPDRPYFEAPTLNFFLVVKIRFSQVNIFQFSDDYYGSQKRFTDRL